ncbi:response regulator transcription factor [Actinoplanes solisilvae]|uniref:response regulator transcription factor n=1 Tax=Actinoplanes solisilvae TaxID=2486853 RepID=UPI000FDABC9E|nr:response regulator transcription factor [Actinoplanes solisilvae]
MNSIDPVAVVAADSLVRAGITRMLAQVPGIAVRHELADVAVLRGQRQPILIVLDLHDRPASRTGAAFWAQMPDGHRTVALCRPDDPPDLLAAVQSGATSLLTRRSAATELHPAVDAARRGALYLSADLTPSLLQQATAVPSTRELRLTEREIETLRWVAQGLTHGQIGRRMGLTESTVNTYVKRLRAKLNTGNKAELTRRAIELGYVATR